jgi:DNA-binding transcriptional MerR regulator
VGYATPADPDYQAIKACIASLRRHGTPIKKIAMLLSGSERTKSTYESFETNRNVNKDTIDIVKGYVLSTTPEVAEVQKLKDLWQPQTEQHGPVDRRTVEQKKNDAYEALLKQRNQLKKSQETLSESKLKRESADFEQSAVNYQKTYFGGTPYEEPAVTSIMGYLQDKGGLSCYNLHKETWQNTLHQVIRHPYEHALERPNGIISLLRNLHYVPPEVLEVHNEAELRDLLLQFEKG